VNGLFNDPVLCPNGVVNKAQGGVAARDCSADFNALSGGDPNLQPQRSTAYTVGFTLSVPEGAWSLGRPRLSVEWWHYDLTDTIGTLAGSSIFGDLARFGSYIVRCSQADPTLRAESYGCTFGGPGNPIAYVVQVNQNLGTIETAGVDLGLNWSMLTRYGTIGLSYRSTYVATYNYQLVPGGPISSRKGIYQDGFPVIPYSHFGELTWDQGPWSVALQNRLEGGYEDCNAECGIAPQYWDRVGVYSLWNLAGAYHFNDAWTIALHVNNMFDTNPPFTNQTNGNCTGCDLRYIDPTGRSFGITFVGKLGTHQR
jgi:iron complex outermembrane receptor protein